MVTCCVVGCSNKSVGKSARQKEKEMKIGRKISFYRFPLDKDLRQVWTDTVKREGWVPTQSSTLCSEHFAEDCYNNNSPFYRKLKKGAIPSIFPIHYHITPLNPIKEESQDEPKRAVQEQPSTSRGLSPIQFHGPVRVHSEELASSVPPILATRDVLNRAQLLAVEEQPPAPASRGLCPIQFHDPLQCEEFAYTLPPISATVRRLMSKTTSFSSDRRRTRPFSPSRAALIKNYKFKMSVYKKRIKYLQQKTRTLAKRIAKL